MPSGCWIGRQDTDERRRAVYLHGGGFLAGSIDMYAGLVSRLAVVTRSWIFFSHYPLAPEYLFPAAHDSAIDACLYVSQHGPFAANSATRQFVVGDSCGAGLALATAMGLRDCHSQHVLDAIVGFSPTLDFTASSNTYVRCAATDKVVSAQLTRRCAASYAPGTDPGEPRLSPLFASFVDLPPILFQVSESEVIHDDSLRAAKAARQCGVQVEVQQWPDLPHVWHLFGGSLRESDEAIANVATFVERASRP